LENRIRKNLKIPLKFRTSTKWTKRGKFVKNVKIPDECKKKNPRTFEVYNSDRESVKFANCVEIPDEYEM